MNLKQITAEDQIELKKIYFDSINSIDEKIYTKDQKRAWSSQAWDNPEFNNCLLEGKGWSLTNTGEIIAFAIRHPKDRLALIYCKGNYKRKGLGTILINKIENDAKNEGIKYLKTEASLISYKLLLKNQWKVIKKENIIIKNQFFDRYKMIKHLKYN